ncbi:MAG: transcription-repair coupling factor, partial [Monoglobales bacterium]
MHHLEKLKEFNEIISAAASPASRILVTGVTSSARADFLYAFLNSSAKKGLIVVENMYEARVIKEDLSFYTDADRIFIFPDREYIFHNIETAEMKLSHIRMDILTRLASGEDIIVIATARSAVQYTLPRSYYDKELLFLRPCDIIDTKDLARKLVGMGYSRCEAVEGVGQFSIRGGIIDIFPPSSSLPLRLELFGDELDTIRLFSPDTQLSEQQIVSCTIPCCRELIVQDFDGLSDKLSSYPVTDWIKSDLTSIKEKKYFPALERYIPLIYPEISTVFDYIDRDSVVFLDYPSGLASAEEIYNEELSSMLCTFAENDSLPILQGEYTASLKKTLSRVNSAVCAIDNITSESGLFKKTHSFNISSRSIPSYGGRLELILSDIKAWKKKEYAITILAGSRQRAEAFLKTLSDNNIIAVKGTDFAKSGEIVVLEGNISKGFEYPLIGVAVISSAEVFGTPKHRKKISSMPGVKIKSFADLSEGDYVVHQVHGIGQYLGIERIVVDGCTKDYLKIRYKGDDVLYVPATSLDAVNKYMSGEDKEVKLNKMGGAEFTKVKSRVKKSLEDIADRLVKLYSARSVKKGFAFSPDNDWQKQFEDNFPYEETPDQLKCIEEVKKDMEKDVPMDRLLCGDVGFGKTEIALRAAFKALMDNKQVAYLVPTTILAQQHYNTFVQRMKDFPVTVEMMSRFRTPKQLATTAEKLAKGQVDVVIGTHRLLQKDISFKDLGLLIIDEEQRFGVKHKELIKELKQDVDVLTLTATPIPRTLHMSLTGIRDMSVIAQPPEDRYPVQTYVLEYDKQVIRDAILKELGRNGQVYYVYNRVEGIYKIANTLQEMAPNARIAVGHGQMSERELESVMMQTISGEIDILVCTTIVETGLDIPNINTIIIENADNMGLAQLYQLRGRVGRSNRVAYAYLTHRKDKVLSETALKRLTAIQEFTEFGS